MNPDSRRSYTDPQTAENFIRRRRGGDSIETFSQPVRRKRHPLMRSSKRKPIGPVVPQQIRAAILEGGLVPGSKIVQDQLAASLGVSRLPIRDALLVLQREGLVLLDHRHGAVVAPLDVKFISDVFDCRAIIEGYVAAELASRPDL